MSFAGPPSDREDSAGSYYSFSAPHPPQTPQTPQTNSRHVTRVVALAVLTPVVAAAVAVPIVRNAVYVSSSPLKRIMPMYAAGTQEFRFPNAHFSAGFTSQPEEQDEHKSLAGVTSDMHFVGDRLTGTIVESADISRRMKKSQVSKFADGVFAGLSNTGQAQVLNKHSTDFRGKKSVEADLASSDGSKLSVLVVPATSKRIYVLIAPSGPAFDNLLASFSPLP